MTPYTVCMVVLPRIHSFIFSGLSVIGLLAVSSTVLAHPDHLTMQNSDGTYGLELRLIPSANPETADFIKAKDEIQMQFTIMVNPGQENAAPFEFERIKVNILYREKIMKTAEAVQSKKGIASVTYVFPSGGTYTADVTFYKGETATAHATFPVTLKGDLPPKVVSATASDSVAPAAAAIAPGKASFPLSLIIGSVVIALLLLAIVFLIIRRKRAPKLQAPVATAPPPEQMGTSNLRRP